MADFLPSYEDRKWDRVTIEKDSGNWWVVGHGTYESSSILAGQYKRSLIHAFDTAEEAKVAYPKAEVIEGSTRPMRSGNESLADLSGLPKCPPSDFDPADAGESWDEDY